MIIALIQGGGGGGGGRRGRGKKSVLLRSSVTECPIEIILSGITTTIGSRNLSNLKIFVFILSNEGSFSHLFDSLDSRIEPNLIGLCLAIRITFVLKK